MNSAQTITATARGLSRINRTIGYSVAWLCAFMAVTVFILVSMRTFFNCSSIAGQESLTYMHATLLMLASAFTLQLDGHIRVDIFYHRFSQLAQAWTNAFGVIFFLLPFATFILFVCWPGMMTSWRIGETSANTGGIPLTFLLKSLPPAMAVMLILQGIAYLLESINTIVWQEQ